MSSTITKFITLCSLMLLFGTSRSFAQQDCNSSNVSMSCNNLVNISLGVSCTQQIQPQDLLTSNSFSCYNNFIVNILNTNLGNTIGAAQIGKTYDVRITHTLSGNSCWGKVKVEDKTAPYISCKTDTTNVNCSDTTFRISYGQKIIFDNIPNNGITDVNSSVFGRPLVMENCGGYTLSYNDNVENLDCTLNGTIALVTRTWRAIDAQGNVSLCKEYYRIWPEQLSSITIPSDLTIDCGDVFPLDGKGNISPSFSGYPKLHGILIDGVTVNLCQIAVGYQDSKTAGSCSGYTIVRKWTLTNWCEKTGATYGPVSIQVEQLIHVKDTKKPTFFSWNIPTIVPTDINNCYVSTYVPTPPQAKDNCDASLDFFYELYNQNRTTLITKGTTLKNIQPGWFVLIARATDDCGLTDTISTMIHVKDITPPVASCDQNTKISLTVDGTAMVNATSFNDGSSDNCCIDTMLFVVRRMSEDDSQYRKVIKFDCADGIVPVVLRVADCNGNTNTCMVNALVEDKMPPVIFAEDGEVTCGGEPVARQWLDDHKPKLKTLNSSPSPTNPGYYDNCSVTVTYVDVVGIDQCSVGSIKRVWTATDASGRTGTTVQTVVAKNRSAYTISYPKDVTINCNTQNIDITPAALGSPTIVQESNSCAIPTVTYVDKVIGSGACYKVVRIWKVLNICQNSMVIAPNAYDEGMQNIHIIDLVPPVIGNVEIETKSDPKKCFATEVELKKTGITDNCAKDIQVTYTSNIPNYEAGFLPATLLNVPYGKYTLNYRASDNCGNFTIKTFEITIKDDQKPTPACHDNLAISLGSSGQAMLMARQVDAGSTDNCTENNKLQFRLQVPAPVQGAPFDITKTDTMYTFRCPTSKPASDTSNFKVYPIALWVGDENGNWDYCETVVVVQDNMKMCPATVLKPMAGIIATSDNKPLEGVNLILSGDVTKTVKTDKNGAFDFGNVPALGNYELTPEKNDYALNGVSTYDLVLMTKHILGVQPFQNSTQYIAADVNKSGNVSTSDVVELRKLILGLQSSFTKNTSWRFIEREKTYPISSVSSWLSSLPNKKQILNLDNLSFDFTAIKVGDLNQSAKTNSLVGTGNGRSQNTIIFEINQNEVEANETVTLTFSGNEMENIEGYQMALNYDKNNLELLEIHGNKEAFAVPEDGLITHSQVGNVADTKQLFGLTFRAKQKVDLTQAISLNERMMLAEAYNNEGEIKGIDLKFKQKTAIKSFEVYQNQPNPFDAVTFIGFQLPEAKHVKLTVSDISGRVLKITEGDFSAGYQQFTIDRSELNASGILYYRVETPTQSITKKMLVIE